jgi:hypothetical protein
MCDECPEMREEVKNETSISSLDCFLRSSRIETSKSAIHNVRSACADWWDML